MTEIEVQPRLAAFLEALPHAGAEDFVNAVGLGVFRAKHVRRGLERGVVAVHWTGVGLCIVQPKTHGVCPECVAAKGRTICEHCRCEMCSWFRVADERASPPVGRARMQELARQLRAFQMGAPRPVTVPALDDNIL